MQYRSIGSLNVSLLGLGTSRLASLGAAASRSDAARLLDVASDLGVNFIDTADTYGSSDCERLLGELLAGKQDRFHISTKGGLTVVDLPGRLRYVNQIGKKALQQMGRRHDFSPPTIARCIDNSLRRLQREVLDVYFLHEPPASVLGDEGLLDVLRSAVKNGKVRYFGVASDDPEVVLAASNIADCSVVQTKAGGSDALGEVFGRADGMSLVVNQATSSFSGPVQKAAEGTARERGLSRLGVLLRHAAVAPAVRVVLTGTSNPAHLRENAQAFEAPLTEADNL